MMEYNFKTHFHKISNFKVSNNILLTISKEGIKINNEILLIDYNEFNVINFIDVDSFFYGNLQVLMLENIDTKKKISLNPTYSYYWDSIKQDKVLISNNRRTDFNGERIADYYWYNIKENKVDNLLFTDIPQIKIITNFAYFTSFKSIKSLSLLTGDYEWEINLEEELSKYKLDKIEKIIGVYNDILWVSCSNALWGIDNITGRIEHTFTKPTQIMHQSGALDFFRGYDGYIDEEKGKLIGFEHETYFELDLVDLSFKYWIFTKECNEMFTFAPHIGKKCYTTTHIYFIDNIYGKVILFNRATKKFDWIYTFAPESCTGILNDIQITNHKLYVLDTGGTLHIFEKQINNQ